MQMIASIDDINQLPNINLDNFINISHYVDYYQKDYEEFIENIRFYILCKNEIVTNQLSKIPLEMQKEINDHECILEMKCTSVSIKHICCYKYIEKTSMIRYNINDACRDGNLEVAKYMFSLGQDCTTWAIEDACANGHLKIVRYLIEERDKDCTTKAINHSVKNGHLPILQYLLEKQNKKFTNETISLARVNKQHKVIKYLYTKIFTHFLEKK